MADSKTTITITARDDTRAALDRIRNSFAGINAAASRLTLIGPALAGAFSGAAITAGIKSVIDGADQLQKASQKYGIAVEQLSALKYAGALADVSLEAIGTGLKKLSVNMADTAAGTGEAKDAFKALGISVTEAGGGLKSSDQVLGELADKFAGMEDGAGKTALAVKIFGRAGADLIPLLNQGSKGLADMKAEAEQLGAIVGGDLARASEQFNDNMTRLGKSAEAFKIALAQELLPTLNQFVEQLIIGRKHAGGFWEAIKNFGTINPFKNHQENLRTYADDLAKIERRLQFAIGADERAALEKDATRLRQRIGYLKEIAQLEALAGSGSRGRLDAKDLGPTVLAKAPAPPDTAVAKKKAVADLAEVEGYAEKIRNAVGAAITDNAVTRAREYADQVAFLDKLFFEAGLDAEIYAAALDKISGATAKSSVEKSRLNELLANTPSAQLEKTRDDMILLAQAFEDGRINAEQYFEAVAANLPKVEAALDEMTEFTRQAARNMQDAMADGFFNIMQGKFDSLAGNFKQTIDRMVANLLASQLMNFLTGDFGKTGVLGGWIGGLLDGARAEGGPVAAGGAYLVGERGPELFVPRQPGSIVPNGGVGAVAVYNTFNLSGPMDRRSQQQIAAEVGRAVDRASRRNR